MNKNTAGLTQVGKVLLVAIVALGTLGVLSAFLGDMGGSSRGGLAVSPDLGLFGAPLANATDTGNQPQSKVIVGNVPPSVSGIKFNNNSDVILNVNGTTSVPLFYIVSDNNGCGAINTNAMTSTLFRANPAAVCSVTYPATSNLNCYLYASRSTSSCSGTSINVTDTFVIWYYADATGNASATYGASSYWDAHIQAIDTSASTTDATSSNQNITVLTGLTVTTSTINYGAMSANTTSTVDSIATTTNAGNSTTSLKLSELQDLNNGSGGNISSTYQHYATSTFSYGGSEQVLQGSSSPALVQGVTLVVQTSTVVGVSSSKAIFWRIQIPAVATGSYSGVDTFTSVWSQ